ncbi:hypothetical protein D3C76_680630 [compost metagenome]
MEVGLEHKVMSQIRIFTLGFAGKAPAHRSGCLENSHAFTYLPPPAWRRQPASASLDHRAPLPCPTRFPLPSTRSDSR